MPRSLLRFSLFQSRPASATGKPSPAAESRHVVRFVTVVYLACVGVLAYFVVRHVSRVPYHDEFSNFQLIFGGGQYSPAEFWGQHNEHRIPLPRLLYVLAVRLTGLDFRMPVYLNALMMAAVVAFLLATVRRVRGRFAVADAFIPLTVLSVGQWENLLCGFQVQFILSTVLALAILGLVAAPGLIASPRRIALAGLCAMLLPLCGANGVALSPALGLGFLALAWQVRREDSTPAFRVALVAGLLTMVMVPLYFYGLTKTEYHPPPESLWAVAVSAVNLLGVGGVSATPFLHSPGYDGITATGAAASVLVFATSVMLLLSLRDPARRPQAIALGSLLAGLLCLVAGLAYGRAGMGNVMSANRYVTLTMPVVVVAYFAWVACGRGHFAKVIPAGLFAVAALSCVPNAWYGFAIGRWHTDHLKQLEHAIKVGLPHSFLAEQYPFAYPGPSQIRLDGLALLRDKGVKPFRDIKPDPKLTAEPVPIRVVRVTGLDETPAGYRVTGANGHVVFALPRRQHVYGFRIVYTASFPNPNLPGTILSWDEGGRFPPTPGFSVINQLRPNAVPTTTTTYVNGETDLLRIDLFAPGTTLRLYELHVLTRAD